MESKLLISLFIASSYAVLPNLSFRFVFAPLSNNSFTTSVWLVCEANIKALSDETKMYTFCDPDFSGILPGYYSLIHENEEALKYLDHALNRGFINYHPFAEINPFLENIRNEERFKKLIEQVKYEWENFEVQEL